MALRKFLILRSLRSRRLEGRTASGPVARLLRLTVCALILALAGSAARARINAHTVRRSRRATGPDAVRPSRRLLRRLLRMRNFLNAINKVPHPEERRRRVSKDAVYPMQRSTLGVLALQAEGEDAPSALSPYIWPRCNCRRPRGRSSRRSCPCPRADRGSTH